MIQPVKQIMIIKANGKREAFEPEKLRFSLLKSGATEKMAEDVLSHISLELGGDMTTSEI